MGRFRPGPLSPSDAAALSELADTVARLGKITGGGAARVSRSAGGTNVFVPRTAGYSGFDALITGQQAAGVNSYSFQQIYNPNPPTGWADVPAGLASPAGTFDAYELNGNAYVPAGVLGVGAQVWMWPSIAVPDQWEFEYTGLTVEDVNPTSTTVAPTTLLEIDNTSGILSLSNPAPGVAELSASLTDGEYVCMGPFVSAIACDNGQMQVTDYYLKLPLALGALLVSSCGPSGSGSASGSGGSGSTSGSGASGGGGGSPPPPPPPPPPGPSFSNICGGAKFNASYTLTISGGCSTLNGSYPLVWNGSAWQWSGTINGHSGCSFTLSVGKGTSFTLSFSGDGSSSSSQYSYTCPPSFTISGVLPDSGNEEIAGCIGTTINWTVS